VHLENKKYIFRQNGFIKPFPEEGRRAAVEAGEGGVG
jgi:hypothetical protein